jgi:glycosyltransferase involved in cell wall biosynthesis
MLPYAHVPKGDFGMPEGRLMQATEAATARRVVQNDGPFRLSVVVPIYNEEANIPTFLERVVPLLERATPDYEIVCVNDGSSDQTLAVLLAARSLNPRLKIIDLTRNFGKEAALTAGLDFTTGDAVIPLDADLQDPPELIPDLLAKWREGNDVVLAIRVDRNSDTRVKRGSANLFYRVLASMSEVPIPSNAGDFRLMDRRVIEAVRNMPERTRFMKGMFAWLGFRQARITYVRPARGAGSTKWRLWSLWNFALDGILSFTTLPLRIWTYFGLTVALAALAYGLYIVLRTLIYGIDVPGYASILVMLLFFSGMNMIGLGILGEYVGRIFVETKRRPLYLAREIIGFEASAAVPISREARIG